MYQNSELQPRKSTESTEMPRWKCLEPGLFSTAPFSYEKLSFALFVPFRGHSISEFGIKVANK